MRKLFAFAFTATLLFPANSQANDQDSAIKELERQGVNVVYEFEAPMGLRGFVGEADGQNLTFYASEDGKNLIIGTMIDGQGNDLSERVIHNQVIKPKLEREWGRLENSRWVQDGSQDAELVLYTFTDPNCPYCAHFRKQINPWIESKTIQLRHVMVGMLAEDSVDKSAMILASDNPGDLLHEQQKTMRQGGIETDGTLVSRGYLDVRDNTNLMGDLGFGGTPMTLYRDHNGDIQVIRGILSANQLKKLKSEGF